MVIIFAGICVLRKKSQSLATVIRIADVTSAKLSRNLSCRVAGVSAMQLRSYGLVSTCYTAVINLPAGKCVYTGMPRNDEGEEIDRASPQPSVFPRNLYRGIFNRFKTHDRFVINASM